MLLRRLTILVFVFFTVLAAAGQEKKIIKLKQQPMNTRLQYYHIADVKDDRTDTSNIGSIRAGLFSKKYVSIDLPGGAANALRGFFQINLRQDTNSMPITLHIQQLEVAEKTGGLKAESEVRMHFWFYNGDVRIAEYTGGGTIQAAIDAGRYIEDLIRRSVDDILHQFDTWVGQHQEQLNTMVKGPSVEVVVEMPSNTDDTGKIAFSNSRPLVLDDFQGRPDDLSRASAATYSGIDVKTSTATLYGQTKVTVTVVPFFDKERSWCRSNSRNARTLQHEQMHFNITVIKACELVAAIRTFKFSTDSYMKELEQLYRQKDKEGQQMQQQYDGETNHGQIIAAQAKWEGQIRGSLGKQDCYK